MKILLISDTHGDLAKVRQVYEKLNHIDLILHCGDYQHDAAFLAELLSVPIISVKGNCDGAAAPDHKIVETPHGNLMMTHGHLEGAGFDYNKLLYLAEESGCIATCFGHTHQPLCENFDGILLINPGSLSRPRDGSNGSYAIIHSTESEFYANIIYYDRIFPDGPPNESTTKKKDKVRGGFLRGLLNNSDRF